MPFHEIEKFVKSVFPDNSGRSNQSRAIKYWNRVKSHPVENRKAAEEEVFVELRMIQSTRKRNLYGAWFNANQNKKIKKECPEKKVKIKEESKSPIKEENKQAPKEVPAPEGHAVKRANKRIAEIDKELNTINSALLVAEGGVKAIFRKKQLEKEKKKLKARNKIRKDNAAAQRRKRQRERIILKQHGVAHDAPGRPPLESKIPELPDLILTLCAHKALADPKRRTELIHSLQSLKDLHKDLNANPDVIKSGVVIGPGALYLRLKPRNSFTRQGKLHVHAVPVKLAKAQFSARKPHESLRFCRALHRMGEQLIA